MTTIVVDNLTPSTGGTATTLNEGVATMLVSWQQAAYTRTISSLNVSSIVDLGSGVLAFYVYNNWSSANPTLTGLAFYGSSEVMHNNFSNTSNTRLNTRTLPTNSDISTTLATAAALGDLA